MAYGHLNGTGNKLYGRNDTPAKGGGVLKTGTEKVTKGEAKKKAKPVNLAKIKGLK